MSQTRLNTLTGIHSHCIHGGTHDTRDTRNTHPQPPNFQVRIHMAAAVVAAPDVAKALRLQRHRNVYLALFGLRSAAPATQLNLAKPSRWHLRWLKPSRARQNTQIVAPAPFFELSCLAYVRFLTRILFFTVAVRKSTFHSVSVLLLNLSLIILLAHDIGGLSARSRAQCVSGHFLILQRSRL